MKLRVMADAGVALISRLIKRSAPVPTPAVAMVDEQVEAPKIELVPEVPAPVDIRFALSDVLSACTTQDEVIVDRSTVQRFLNGLGDGSEEDRQWAHRGSNPRPYIVKLDDVTIIPGSRLIIREPVQAMSDELEYSYRVWGHPPKRNMWNMQVIDGPTLSVSPLAYSDGVIETGIHITSEHETNYFHWFVEVVPRLFLYESLIAERSHPLIVSRGLHPNLYRLLDLVRDPRRPVVFVDRDKCCKVGTLIFPADASRILDEHDRAPSEDTMYIPVPLIAEIVSQVKAKVMLPATGQTRRVFLIRNRTYRIPTNQKEVEILLQRYGFDTVDTGTLTMDEQIALFSEVRYIVAPSGAPCTNMVWCPRGAKVLILHSDHPHLSFPYWSALGRVAHASVSYLAFPRTGKRQSAHDDFEVDLRVLEDALVTMLSEDGAP